MDLRGTDVAHFDCKSDAVLTRVGSSDMVQRADFDPARRFGGGLGGRVTPA
jgi:hypothetical protein